MTIDEAKEFIRWGYDLGHRYCSHHQNWPPPWPNNTIRDAGPFRDTLELQLLGEVLSRASHGQSHAQIEEWVKSVVTPAPPETGELPAPDLRIRGARGAYLYPGDSNWLFSQRMVHTVQDSDILAWLETGPQQQSTHVVISVSTGLRPQLGEQPFNPLENDASEQRVRHVLELLRRAGKQVWCYACSQEFILQNNLTIAQIEDHMRGVGALVRDVACCLTPFRELGDVWGSSDMDKRNRVFRALRQGAPHTPLACHERAGEQIPVADFHGVSGPTVSALQTGFGMALDGGSYTIGGHTYTGAIDFCRQNKTRMANYSLSGQLEGEHVSGCFEASIPDVGFTSDHRTWAEAQSFGQALVDSGAADFDMSGAGVLAG